MTTRVSAVGFVLFALSMVLLNVSTAQAVLLSPGVTIGAVGEADPLGGIVIAGGAPVPFAAATFSGTLTTSVISGDTSNPWGGLTFTYLVTNDPGTNAIGRITINDFAGFLVNSSYQTPVAGVAPAFNDRSAGAGDVVGFTFFGSPIGSGVILPGAQSALLVLQTNASLYQSTTVSVIDGSVATVASFAPVVPEPSTLVLAVAGIAVGACVRKRIRFNPKG